MTKHEGLFYIEVSLQCPLKSYRLNRGSTEEEGFVYVGVPKYFRYELLLTSLVKDITILLLLFPILFWGLSIHEVVTNIKGPQGKGVSLPSPDGA